MTTKTAICNQALLLLGAAPSLVNVDTDSTVPASKLKAVFDNARDATLRAHAWNFATVRDTLAAMTAAPAWGYGKKYQLPPEYLGQLRFSVDYHGRKPHHRVLGRELHTDEGSPVYVEFVQRVTDTALFDPLYAEVLAAKLAELTGYSITGRNIALDMRDYVKDLARDARWADAIDTGRDQPDEGEFLASRMAG